MFRTAFLSLILVVSLSSSSILRKSISRRQTDAQYCHAIEGFECKCSYSRVTCTNDRDLQSPINILQNEKNKYTSVELVITAARDINVNDQTFAPVKELYKSDADNLEFRIKFEKFTALHLTSPGIFNGVFPDNLPSNTRKHLALEIYSPDVPPNDNPNLFKNFNADSLELYALYPFHGSFQQLFDGANIKYIRLSGGDIRSDLSQPFSGNIGRLELAKQANELSVQNFPVYPAHELTINAFYITEFNHAHPPNYNNLGELRVFSTERIPANAFVNFPNIHTLSISTEKDIDPQALNGLNKLEKLIIKDTKAPIELLNSVPSIKEFETNIEKLDDKTQCQLIEKLANGQVAVQAIPNGRECTCVTAYLDTSIGRTPCAAQHCEHSSCATIKNNYDATTGTFKQPPLIRRSDGSNALQQREPHVYTAPFQVAYQDQEKLQKGIPQSVPSPSQTEDNYPKPPSDNQDPWQQNPSYNPQDTYERQDYDSDKKSDQIDDLPFVENNPNYNNNQDYGNNNDDLQPPKTTAADFDLDVENDVTTTPSSLSDGQQPGQDQDSAHGGSDSSSPNQGGENQPGDGSENQSGADGNQSGVNAPDTLDGAAGNGTETATGPPKKGMSWLPIIIIAASIVALLLIGLVILLLRKKRASSKGGYGPTATNEQGAAAATARG